MLGNCLFENWWLGGCLLPGRGVGALANSQRAGAPWEAASTVWFRAPSLRESQQGCNKVTKPQHANRQLPNHEFSNRQFPHPTFL